jgi:hypothetical protein
MNKRGIIIPGKKGFQRKTDDVTMTEFVTFTISKQTKMKLKLFCVENDMSQSELLRLCLDSVLNKATNE